MSLLQRQSCLAVNLPKSTFGSLYRTQPLTRDRCRHPRSKLHGVFILDVINYPHDQLYIVHQIKM